MSPDTVTLSIGANDTAQTLAARYTIGGVAYAPAIINYNSAWGEVEGEIGTDVPLRALGISSAEVPVDWVKPALLAGSSPQTPLMVSSGEWIAGVPNWVLIAGAILLVASR